MEDKDSIDYTLVVEIIALVEFHNPNRLESLVAIRKIISPPLVWLGCEAREWDFSACSVTFQGPSQVYLRVFELPLSSKDSLDMSLDAFNLAPLTLWRGDP
ncbi:hypothetical protein Tco_1525958 [Tanacetum coccineum]